jgi:hypothetical protein
MPGDVSVHYGYGLLNFEMRGARVLMHGGFSRGYGSMIQMFPEQGFCGNRADQSQRPNPATKPSQSIEIFLKLQPEQPDKPKKAEPLTQTERQLRRQVR